MLKIVFFLLFFSYSSFAQTNSPLTRAEVQKMIDQKYANEWYNKINIKGYAQVRYNRLLETNKDLNCTACDKSIGDKQGLMLRRGRIVLFGEANERVYFYVQPDYGTDAGSSQHYFQIRDAYFDYALTSSKDFRIRSGLSKIPYGFQNLQSSSNRGPLDRDDGMNSGVPNERDLGVFFMYSPTEIRKRFKQLTSNNLKGTGDYGMFAIGAYNGQSLNKAEKNNDLHRVVRLTYPFQTEGGQFIEASVQAFEGKFFVDNKDHYEQRTAASLVFYPQPFGFQIEYNVGVGPEFDAGSNEVEVKKLKGGYAMVNYQFEYQGNRFFPFVRYQKYDGGRKTDDHARSYDTNEWEIGTEWQPNNAFELTASYAIADRVYQSTQTDRTHEKGSFLRLQAQFNY